MFIPAEAIHRVRKLFVRLPAVFRMILWTNSNGDKRLRF